MLKNEKIDLINLRINKEEIIKEMKSDNITLIKQLEGFKQNKDEDVNLNNS